MDQRYVPSSQMEQEEELEVAQPEESAPEVAEKQPTKPAAATGNGQRKRRRAVSTGIITPE